jgi:hypothetical protein
LTAKKKNGMSVRNRETLMWKRKRKLIFVDVSSFCFCFDGAFFCGVLRRAYDWVSFLFLSFPFLLFDIFCSFFVLPS